LTRKRFKIGSKVESFISDFKKVILKQDYMFLLRSLEEVKDPFPPHFYITWKLHKTLLKTRLIMSVSGSALHSLGSHWLDIQLQPIYKALPSSFTSSSWELSLGQPQA
jgi:hypothetical protein